MKVCNKCNVNEVPNKRCRICLDCKNGKHGLKYSEIVAIAEQQGMKCPLSGFPLIVRGSKVIDSRTGKGVAIDHDHSTGVIRGLLSERLNWLADMYHKGHYGMLEEPTALRDYRTNPPAVLALGERQYKE
tara:strand:- start:2534 stop:2923 length:390 start_codon:yes stop_codon:yes gene_type:complete